MLVNQSWFMGAFFLVARYFTPGSFDRKGSDSFLKDRLLHLGIPPIVFLLLLSPISSIGYWLMLASLTGVTTPLTLRVLASFLGLGPTWFLALLVVFSFDYAEWRRLARNWASSPTPQSSPPSYLQTGVFIPASVAVSYLVRMVVAIGKTILEFPTLAYLPQCLSFFVLGIVAPAATRSALCPAQWHSCLCVSTGGGSLRAPAGV